MAALIPLPLLPTSALAVIAAVASLSPPLLPTSAMLLMLLPAVDAALLPMSPSSLLPVAALPLLPVSALQPQLPRSPRSLRCRCYLSPSPLLPISALPPLLPLLLLLYKLCCRAAAAAFAPVVLVAALLLLYKLPRCRCYPSPRCRCCFVSVAARVTVGAARLRDAAAIDVSLLLTELPHMRHSCSQPSAAQACAAAAAEAS